MDEFLDSAAAWNWTAIGTIALAAVTTGLAVATARMVKATRDMAFHTRRLADAEAARRSAEQRAYLRVGNRIGRRASYTYVFQNHGNGTATDIEILYSRDEIQTVLRRTEVAPREVWRLQDGDLENPAYRGQTRLPSQGIHPAIRMAWSDEGGHWESETYVWHYESLAPDVRPS